jgi:hypothetical protein
MKRDQLQTMRIAFEQICAGEREWTALGNFMNYWYAYAKDRREELVADPLPAYDEQSLYLSWTTVCSPGQYPCSPLPARRGRAKRPFLRAWPLTFITKLFD